MGASAWFAERRDRLTRSDLTRAEMLEQLGADIERPRHRRLALRRRDAHQLGVFGIHLLRRAAARDGEMPGEHEHDEDDDRDERGAQREGGGHGVWPTGGLIPSPQGRDAREQDSSLSPPPSLSSPA